MSKNERLHTLQVGAFVAIGLALFIGSIFLLGGDRFFLKETEKLYIEFNHVQGLTEGSIVSLAGLQVGNVRSITLASHRNIVIAELLIEKQYFDRITDTAKISVRTQGALGDKYIYIDPGIGGTPVAPNSTLHSDLQPDLLEILSSKTNEVSGSVVDLVSELHTLLKQMNDKNRSALLMENLVNTSQNLKKLSDDPELKEAVTHLTSILRKIDRGEGTLGQLINDPTLHERLTGFLGESPRNRYLVPLIRESIKSLESQPSSR